MDAQSALRRAMIEGFVRAAFEKSFGVEFLEHPFCAWLWNLAERDLIGECPAEAVVRDEGAATPLPPAPVEKSHREYTPQVQALIDAINDPEDPEAIVETIPGLPVEPLVPAVETAVRRYIADQMAARQPIDPKLIFDITCWDASRIRQFIAQAQDELRLQSRRGGEAPPVGLGALILAINEPDEDEEPPAAELAAIEGKQATAPRGSNALRFADKSEEASFYQARKKAVERGESFSEALWKQSFRERKASRAKEAGN